MPSQSASEQPTSPHNYVNEEKQNIERRKRQQHKANQTKPNTQHFHIVGIHANFASKNADIHRTAHHSTTPS